MVLVTLSFTNFDNRYDLAANKEQELARRNLQVMLGKWTRSML